MTHLCSTLSPIDLPMLDWVIAKHLQAHARHIGGDAEQYATNATTSASALIVLMDPDQDLFSGNAEAVFAYRMFEHGYEAALALAAVVARSPFSPDDIAISAALRETRARIVETVADDRAKWGHHG